MYRNACYEFKCTVINQNGITVIFVDSCLWKKLTPPLNSGQTCKVFDSSYRHFRKNAGTSTANCSKEDIIVLINLHQYWLHYSMNLQINFSLDKA